MKVTLIHKKSEFWLTTMELTFPSISYGFEKTFTKARRFEFSMPTGISYTSNKFCVTINISLLGFGIYFYIRELINE